MAIPPPLGSTTRSNFGSRAVHKTLATAANLANLLPANTVLAFQALIPSFSNNGSCLSSNKYLTGILLAIFSLFCYLSSFTDSFVDSDGKLRYGIATCSGLYVFNNEEERKSGGDLAKFRVSFVDFVHAFLSLSVFLIFALSDQNVQSCFLLDRGPNLNAFVTNLPLGAGVLSSLMFTIFPTTRRGIGYSDIASRM